MQVQASAKKRIYDDMGQDKEGLAPYLHIRTYQYTERKREFPNVVETDENGKPTLDDSNTPMYRSEDGTCTSDFRYYDENGAITETAHYYDENGEVTETVYYYDENEEKYIMLTYLDYMGYDYFETLFKKTPPKEKKENKRQNCVNCGAPLTYGDVCEYCGTIH